MTGSRAILTPSGRHLPPSVKILAVIKADAYGHGAATVASLLREKADYFAVAFTDEAVALRRAGIETPIMVLGHIPPTAHRTLVKWSITGAIPALEDALSLSRAAVRMGKTVKAHIALDTGMSRIGFLPCPETVKTLKRICALPGLEIEGIFSHFASADDEDLHYAYEQKRRFCEFLAALKEEGFDPPLKHLYNSAAAVRWSLLSTWSGRDPAVRAYALSLYRSRGHRRGSARHGAALPHRTSETAACRDPGKLRLYLHDL